MIPDSRLKREKMAQENVVLPIDKYNRLMEQINKDISKVKKKKEQINEQSKLNNIKKENKLLDNSNDNNTSSSEDDQKNREDANEVTQSQQYHKQQQHQQSAVNSAAMPPGINAEEVLPHVKAKKLRIKGTSRIIGSDRHAKKKMVRRKSTKKRDRLFENWIVLSKKR